MWAGAWAGGRPSGDAADPNTEHVTRFADRVAGTLSYMSPKMFKGFSRNARGSLGVYMKSQRYYLYIYTCIYVYLYG